MSAYKALGLDVLRTSLFDRLSLLPSSSDGWCVSYIFTVDNPCKNNRCPYHVLEISIFIGRNTQDASVQSWSPKSNLILNSIPNQIPCPLTVILLLIIMICHLEIVLIHTSTLYFCMPAVERPVGNECLDMNQTTQTSVWYWFVVHACLPIELHFCH